MGRSLWTDQSGDHSKVDQAEAHCRWTDVEDLGECGCALIGVLLDGWAELAQALAHDCSRHQQVRRERIGFDLFPFRRRAGGLVSQVHTHRTIQDHFAARMQQQVPQLPYRIRRRRSSDEARYELTDQVSSILSRMAFHQAWLQIDAPDVAPAYTVLVATARAEAGSQMTDAWLQDPIPRTEG